VYLFKHKNVDSFLVVRSPIKSLWCLPHRHIPINEVVELYQNPGFVAFETTDYSQGIGFCLFEEAIDFPDRWRCCRIQNTKPI